MAGRAVEERARAVLLHHLAQRHPRVVRQDGRVGLGVGASAGITAENFELTDAISHAMSRWEKVATVVSAASGLSGNLSLADDGSDSGSDNSGGISPSVAAPDRECPTPRLQAIAARERHRQEGQAPPPATPVRQAGANVVDQNFAAPPGSARRQHSERMAQEASTGQYYTEIIPLLDNTAVLTL